MSFSPHCSLIKMLEKALSKNLASRLSFVKEKCVKQTQRQREVKSTREIKPGSSKALSKTVIKSNLRSGLISFNRLPTNETSRLLSADGRAILTAVRRVSQTSTYTITQNTKTTARHKLDCSYSIYPLHAQINYMHIQITLMFLFLLLSYMNFDSV